MNNRVKSSINENSLDLLQKRYFQERETEWDHLAKRVSKSVAKAEDKKVRKYWEKEYFNMISSLDFIPSTPCLINANEEGTGQLSSCFIISLEDKIESIYKAKGECAKIFQKNGGYIN